MRRNAYYITGEGEKKVKPLNGKDFSLKELQNFVGGLIEIVQLPLNKNYIMVVNEMGKNEQLPINETATLIYQLEGGSDTIVGNALYCHRSMVQ